MSGLFAIILPVVCMGGGCWSGAGWVRVSRAIKSFNGKPKATAFQDLHQLDDAEFTRKRVPGLPLNEEYPACYRA